ncbi:MAG: AlpA family phage regulatory protein [Alphaproteobacteria bacterium]|nr:AlpA family phage regulatory protein [Alphaproteobacteria bacterium]
MTHEAENPKERILRLADVKDRTGLSRSTIYLNIANGLFPSPVSLGRRCVGWLESEVDSWIAARIRQSRPTDFNR